MKDDKSALRAPSPVPIWPRAKPAFVRAMLAGHSALGLAFAALIYLVCFSGSVAVLAPDLPKWEKPQPQLVFTRTLTGATLSQLLSDGLTRAPWADDAFIHLPSKDSPERLSLTLSPDEGDKAHEPATWGADNAGRLTAVSQSTPFSDFIAGLHTSLHIEGGLGGFIVGAAGVALLSSLISGLFAHPRIFKDAFNLRLGGHKRLQEVDLHNRLGVWALPFHILISLSGALLGLTVLIVGVLALAVFKGDTQKAYALFSGPHPVPNERIVEKPINFAPILMDVSNRAPKGSISMIQIEHVRTLGADINVTVQSPRHAARGETYVYDRNGLYYGAWGNETGALGQRIYMVLAPLHFGVFGGWPVKIAYVLLGFALTSVTSSGVAIWLARRRDKGRPAMRFERLWTAMVWSQPLAYAVAGVYALTMNPTDDDKIVPIWGSVTFLSFLLTCFVESRPLSLIVRTASTAAIVALVAVHIRQVLTPAIVHNQATPIMWCLDGALLVIAAMIAFSLLQLKLRRADNGV